jgi:hypothetical protein
MWLPEEKHPRLGSAGAVRSWRSFIRVVRQVRKPLVAQAIRTISRPAGEVAGAVANNIDVPLFSYGSLSTDIGKWPAHTHTHEAHVGAQLPLPPPRFSLCCGAFFVQSRLGFGCFNTDSYGDQQKDCFPFRTFFCWVVRGKLSSLCFEK